MEGGSTYRHCVGLLNQRYNNYWGVIICTCLGRYDSSIYQLVPSSMRGLAAMVLHLLLLSVLLLIVLYNGMPVQSFISSSQVLRCLPLPLLPGIILSNTNNGNSPALPLIIWPAYFSYDSYMIVEKHYSPYPREQHAQNFSLLL